MFGEIEGTGYEVIDQRFAKCFVGHTLSSGCVRAPAGARVQLGSPPEAAPREFQHDRDSTELRSNSSWG